MLKEVWDNEEHEPLAWLFVMMYLQLVEGSKICGCIDNLDSRLLPNNPQHIKLPENPSCKVSSG